MWPWPDAGGIAGHACGLAGTLLMLWAAFGYAWRKRPGVRAGASAQRWMQGHVAVGLAGPALVLLHGGLAFRGLAGLTTALMLVVVASGAVGRWVYTALPRDVELATLETGRVGGRARRAAALWWVLHVPLGMAMLLLALVHAAAVLYFRTW